MTKLWKTGLIASVPLVAAMGVMVMSFTAQDAWAGSASASADFDASASASASVDMNASARASAHSVRELAGGVYGIR